MPEEPEVAFDNVNEDGSIDGLSVKFVDVDGVSTRYYEKGQGKPLLLIHGGNWGGAANANTWSTILPKLCDEFRVIAPDRLGCGMTENPPSESDFVYQSELDHMLRFTEEMGFEEFHLVGQSRGGGLSTRMAVEVPEKVNTLSVVNSATLAPAAGDYNFRKEYLHEDLQDEPEEKTQQVFADEYEKFYSKYQYDSSHITDEFVNTVGYLKARPKARKTAEILDGEGQKRWKETMDEHMRLTHDRIKRGHLDMPTLLYWGRNDPSTRLISATSLWEMISQQNPITRLYLANQAGHHPYREYPDEFTSVVKTFIEEWGG